ncbi:Sau3AI family type II restriction endonuclease [Acetoanaerobium noterae]|uniref:Sau3AI family type II restriction endonuclease n=1 Tax=Acetoanaerobium noterae TaxID=745369 RepID=UPI00331E98FC
MNIKKANLKYDDTSPFSIEEYAKKLIGKTFSQICEENHDIYLVENESEYLTSHENKRRKGGLGELIEERYFHYKANNDSKADFEKAGVELKVTPYRINQNKSIVSKERLIITMIDYFEVINQKFYESKLWKKSELILLIYYLYEEHINNRLDYKIGYVKLFTPPEKDLEIIIEDYENIIAKIKEGKAHELSEADTLYLGAAPKASTSKDRRRQPFSNELAKPRAFAFKNSYMTYILNNYIINSSEEHESIIKSKINISFEDYISKKIDSYKGYSVEELCNEFGIEYSKKPKNIEAILAYRILGIKGNRAEEFIKANIVVKTIRIGNNRKIREHMSFPTFKFNELIKEDWDDSSFGNYLRETKFLFIVYKFDKENTLRLKGSQLWNMPYVDIETDVYKVWKKTRKIINEGIQIEYKNGKRYNNFPSSSENKVCHVRPHGKNANDTYELPNGERFTKQSFWLNNDYILSQLKKDFID